MNEEDIPYPQTISDILAKFLQSIEIWSSEIEGSPSDNDMTQLQGIYDDSEKEIREFIAGQRKSTAQQCYYCNFKCHDYAYMNQHLHAKHADRLAPTN